MSSLTSPTPSPSVSSVSPVPKLSPSPSPNPGPATVAALATWDPSGSTRVVISLVDASGAIVASTTAAHPGRISCGTVQGGAVVPIPLASSTTKDRLYFLDGNSVRFLQRDGTVGTATQVPVNAGTTSVFSVSPDDRQIAVAAIDYSKGGTEVLYVQDLVSGSRTDIYSSGPLSSPVWPVGWRSNYLVTAVYPACTQGGPAMVGAAQELHVVNAQTAVRLRTIGGNGCFTPAPPNPSGAICLDGSSAVRFLDWNGSKVAQFAIQPAEAFFPVAAAESPAGSRVGLCCFGETSTIGAISVRSADGKQVYREQPTSLYNPQLGFVDENHLLISDFGSGTYGHIVDLATRGKVAVAAQGLFIGLIPWSLDT